MLHEVRCTGLLVYVVGFGFIYPALASFPLPQASIDSCMACVDFIPFSCPPSSSHSRIVGCRLSASSRGPWGSSSFLGARPAHRFISIRFRQEQVAGLAGVGSDVGEGVSGGGGVTHLRGLRLDFAGTGEGAVDFTHIDGLDSGDAKACSTVVDARMRDVNRVWIDGWMSRS